jgi:exodeoxyribonuclease V gamma subunit
MFQLVYSNRIERLLDELGARVRDQQRGSPLAPVSIVVPSAAVERYVRLGVARVCGVAANLDVTFLTRFAARRVAASGPFCLADAAAFEAMTLALLLDEDFVDRPELAPVRAYLRSSGDSPEALEPRRFQLAARVARLFEEYTYSRADLLLAWRDGLTLDGRDVETEGWQRSLYLGMLGEGPAARASARDGRLRKVPLHEAIAGLTPQSTAELRSVHVFGFFHFARSFHDLFAHIARSADVTVYAPSPCEGFWEDFDPGDPPLLRAWGRVGREQVRALNAAANFDHEDRFVDALADAGAGSLLARIQSDILRRDGKVSSRPIGSDGSVLVLEHASVRRELEAVASEIWELVRNDETLRFDEIAVLVPDANASDYLAHLPVVFHASHELPYQRIGLKVPGDSSVAEAIDLLLALPGGRFTRQDVLRLAVHPAVVASLEDVDASRWLAWCDALGVVHGADRADHEDTYIERDILNWDQGLRRLALGAFMTGDASGEKAPWCIDGEAYVPYEVSESELRDSAAFGTLVRSLLADARFARDASMTLGEWSEYFRVLIETYVSPSNGNEEERLARALRSLQGLAEYDLGERRVGYRLAYEIARARVANMSPTHAGDGVVMSTLASIRPLPFRVVFACGLGEGRFPSPEGEDPLDLRWARRREGDMTARERDGFAFLELVTGTREKLYLSYVSRDPLTGDSLSPSSVVHELLAAIGHVYGVAPGDLRLSHPLRRWDLRYFPDLADRPPSPVGTMHMPEARAEAQLLALRQHLEGSGGGVSRDEVEARAIAHPAWSSLADKLGLARLPALAPVPEARLVVPIYALVKFLELPLQGWARFRVGLDDTEEEDVLAREDEPFETEARNETLLLRDVLLGAKGRPLADAYDGAVEERELRGMGPTGLFAKSERETHLEVLEAWSREVDKFGAKVDSLELHRFGRSSEHARADRVHGPLVLDVGVVDATGVERIVRAEIAGRTLPVDPTAGALVSFFKRRADGGPEEWTKADRERMTLRAFVEHAVLSAAGVGDGVRRTALSIIATGDAATTVPTAFAPLSRDEGARWLRGLVREILGAPHAYYLPCEAVFVQRARASRPSIVSVIEEARREEQRANLGPALRSSYGPVPRPHEYPAPDEESAQAMIASRFFFFFEKRAEVP